MNCETCRRAIERLNALDADQRAALHRHLGDCTECRHAFDDHLGLDRRLAGLARLDAGHVPPTAADLLSRRRRSLQRRFVLAATGAVLAALAAIGLLLVDPPFARYALGGTTVVMLLAAIAALRQVGALGRVAKGAAGPRQWLDQVRREHRQWTLLGPWVSLLFAVLTGFVLVRHGLGDPRGVVYLATALTITAVCAHGFLVRRPALERERVLIEQLGE